MSFVKMENGGVRVVLRAPRRGCVVSRHCPLKIDFRRKEACAGGGGGTVRISDKYILLFFEGEFVTAGECNFFV